jgi:hypothetical protein
MCYNCASLCSLCEGKEGKKRFTYQLFNEIQELKPTIWCLIFFNLINNLELVSCDCVIGNMKLKYFVWTKVVIGVLKFLKLQQLLQFLRVLFNFSHYRTLSRSCHRVYIRSTEWFINYINAINYKYRFWKLYVTAKANISDFISLRLSVIPDATILIGLSLVLCIGILSIAGRC